MAAVTDPGALADAPRWRCFVDRGGTFTDCIALPPGADLLDPSAARVAKVLSAADSPLLAVRRAIGLEPSDPLPPLSVRMGTTLATNALLERRGAAVALVITEGFTDLLLIRDQARPELFALQIPPPAPLQRRTIAAGVRVAMDPRRRTPTPTIAADERARVRQALAEARAAGCTSAAIVVLGGHLAPGADGPEAALEALAREAGFAHVVMSHEVAPITGLLARAETTVVDAYLTPVLQAYLDQLRADLEPREHVASAAPPTSAVWMMMSSGGLTPAAAFRGRDAVLSGPAGGVVAVASVAARHGLPRAIGFDMGGTSTDVCRWAGAIERVASGVVAGVHLRAPMVDVHTVAAGGGSICRFDGARLRVGPDSAGASPGPLAYGDPAAHEVALTDVNVVLGRVVSDRFPVPLATDRARVGLQELAAAVAAATGQHVRPEDVALGLFTIAVEHMAQAIRQVSVARGHDVRDHGLVVFGGAGGQHACALARRLGIATILIHPLAGVLSALGIGLARPAWHGERDVGRVALDAGLFAAIEPMLHELRDVARAELASHGLHPSELELRRTVDLRYRGSETALPVALAGDARALRDAFERDHARVFGYVRDGHPIEAVAVRVEASARTGASPKVAAPPRSRPAPAPRRHATLWLPRAVDQEQAAATAVEVPVWHREDLATGTQLRGPLLVLDATGTVVVDPGFALTVASDGTLVLRRATGDDASGDDATGDDATGDGATGDAATGDDAPERMPQTPAGEAAAAPATSAAQDAADPVALELYAHRFMAIAEQMGEVLRRTALSTNIRERLDFSCAVFDADGGLVANAPHIPVHLGAMSASIRAVLQQHPEPAEGAVFVTNDPARGGSHLPDVTVITPVFIEGVRRAFVASRGHHADIGGTTPGSMPPDSTRLEHEGVVLRGLELVRDGQLDLVGLRAALRSGPYPARAVEDNVADIQAKIAANHAGAAAVQRLAHERGVATLTAYMGHVQADAERRVRAAIAALPPGERRFEDALDDGTPIVVRVATAQGRLTIDFTGTGPAAEGNLNAPKAVTLAAVLYVLRVLVGAAIPLNDGCLRPVDVIVPPGSLLDPPPDRAVAAGNVETAQRVVDVLLGALGLAAASQGTMNNLTFGNASFGYYETVGGGAGAGPGFAGRSGVHTHMTNTRITDPELLEARFPVELLQFALRRGSGGAGRWPGGDGLIRELRFVEPVHVSLLAERRTLAPFGLDGGEAGARGATTIDGRPMPGRFGVDVPAGAVLRLETPGGGGYGPASD